MEQHRWRLLEPMVTLSYHFPYMNISANISKILTLLTMPASWKGYPLVPAREPTQGESGRFDLRLKTDTLPW